jgi:hypothetical protein
MSKPDASKAAVRAVCLFSTQVSMDTNGQRLDRIPPWINYAIKDGDKPVYIGVYYRYVETRIVSCSCRD